MRPTDPLRPPPVEVWLVRVYPLDRQRSIRKFLAELHRCLRDAGVRVRRIRPPVFFGRLKIPGQPLALVDRFVLFPLYLGILLWRHRAESKRIVVHYPEQAGAICCLVPQRVAQIVTCHDLIRARIWRREFKGARVWWHDGVLQPLILRGLKKASAVVCDSEGTRRDVRRLAFGTESRVSVCHPRTGFFRRAHLPAGGRNGGGHLLHVGHDGWYKNRSGCLRIYRNLTGIFSEAPGLVIVGRPGREDLDFVAAEKLGHRVRWCPEVTDDVLAGLYGGASFLLQPSWMEGFGLPMIEAQLCGCPVIVSDREPMREVTGDAALFLDPADERTAAEIVARALRMPPAERESLVARGLRNAGRFGAEELARRYCQVYEQALSERP